MPDYKIGGYHPIHVGEILLDRYVIIQKLGWGHFSTVWLTKDLKYSSYVAIKCQKSAQHYVEAAYDEVEILDKAASIDSNIPELEEANSLIQEIETLISEDNISDVKKKFVKLIKTMKIIKSSIR